MVLRASVVAQAVKKSACKAEDLGSISGLERYPGERKGNPLQYSCLENSMDRGDWRVTAHGTAKTRTQLSMHVHITIHKQYTITIVTDALNFYKRFHTAGIS